MPRNRKQPPVVGLAHHVTGSNPNGAVEGEGSGEMGRQNQSRRMAWEAIAQNSGPTAV